MQNENFLRLYTCVYDYINDNIPVSTSALITGLDGSRGEYLLTVAAGSGDAQLLGLLLGAGMRGCRGTPRRRTTALHVSCQRGFRGIVEMILRSDACDVNAIDESGASAIALAIRGKHWDIVTLLVQSGSQILDLLRVRSLPGAPLEIVSLLVGLLKDRDACRVFSRMEYLPHCIINEILAFVTHRDVITSLRTF